MAGTLASISVRISSSVLMPRAVASFWARRWAISSSSARRLIWYSWARIWASCEPATASRSAVVMGLPSTMATVPAAAAGAALASLASLGLSFSAGSASGATRRVAATVTNATLFIRSSLVTLCGFTNARSPGRSAAEGHPGEADHALLVDVPLLVPEQLTSLGRGRPQEHVEGRGPAPAEVVPVLLDRLPEPSGVGFAQAPAALAVALRHLRQRALVRARRRLVAVAAPDVRHVHAQHPDQALAFLGRQAGQRVDELPHAGVVLGTAPALAPARQRAAQDGQDAHAGAVEVLQEDHLELDRVLERMA